jgi:hydrogenase/urease accessory protein HupE
VGGEGPTSGNLDRIQIVKGWTRSGQSFEKVFDVVWAGDRKPAKGTGVVPPIGSTVDVENATYTNAIGAVELKTVWTDPEFDPSLHAFYYARVLEIPTPRWTTIQAKQLGVPPPDVVAATIQERAWSSPIWYTPSAEARKNAKPGITVADLKKKGAVALSDAQLRALIVEKSVWLENRVTGEKYEILYRRGRRPRGALRHFPRLRARHRAAGRPERAPLQHGLRDGDRLPARGRHRRRAHPSLAMGTDSAAHGGRRRRAGGRVLPVEGDRMSGPPMRLPHRLVAVIGGLVLASCPSRAEAHLVTTGLGPLYDGLLHFALTPEDLVPVLALALLAGLRGVTHGRRALFVLLGGLVASDARLPLGATTLLAALLGLGHGYLNGSALAQPGLGGVGLLGIVAAVFTLVALAASFVVPLRAVWARVVVRVAGSWIAAIGLLLVGWAIRSGA